MTSINGSDIGFVGSTGRMATTLIAKLLAQLEGITALHEGHYLHDKQQLVIPAIKVNFNHSHKSIIFSDFWRRWCRSMADFLMSICITL
jgi:hypothetical protein